MFVLAGVIAAYAVAFIAYNIAANVDITRAVVNSVIVAIICSILSVILIVSALGKWGALLKRVGRHDEADALQSVEVDISEIGAESELDPCDSDARKKEFKRERRENRIRIVGKRWETRKRPQKVEIIIGVCIFLLLGGVATFMFWLEHRELNKYAYDSDYVTTVAVAQPVHIRDTDSYRIMYVYSDAEGNKYVLTNVGHLDGYIPSVGAEIDVYYPVNNPSAGMSTDDAKMLSVGAVVFLSFGILVPLLIIFPYSSVVGLCFGSAFTAIGATFVGGIAMYTHMGVLGAMLSNAVAYAMTCFVLLGMSLALYGLYKLAQNGYYLALYKKGEKLIPR